MNVLSKASDTPFGKIDSPVAESMTDILPPTQSPVGHVGVLPGAPGVVLRAALIEPTNARVLGPTAGVRRSVRGSAWPKLKRPPKNVSLVVVTRLKNIEPPNLSVWFPKIFETL